MWINKVNLFIHYISIYFFRATNGPCLLNLIEDLQQQLLGGSVLLSVSSVQVDEGSFEVRRHFVERAQLDQIQEVEVLQPPGAFALRLRRVETLLELLNVWTPH